MRIRLSVLFGVFALAFCLGAPMVKLSVHVQTEGGRPVEGASVIVRFVKGHSVAKLGKKIRTSWETRTNQDGQIRIPEIPQGEILVQVIAKGYQTFGQKLDLDEEEKTVQVTLHPPQSQYSAH